MTTSNPALSDKVFDGVRESGYDSGAGTMSIRGTVHKTGILLLILLVAASYTWFMGLSKNPLAMPMAFGGSLIGFIVALVTIFKPNWSPWTAPMYAFFKGLFLGGISLLFEMKYPGIAMHAVTGTFGVAAGMVLIYTTGVIQVTERFKLGVVAATFGIFLLYLVDVIMHLFGVSMTFLHQATPLSIGISIAIVLVAALNLILDFDFVEQGARAGLPKFMEWYGAFGLMVTLVWLYLEILRLISKLQNR